LNGLKIQGYVDPLAREGFAFFALQAIYEDLDLPYDIIFEIKRNFVEISRQIYNVPVPAMPYALVSEPKVQSGWTGGVELGAPLCVVYVTSILDFKDDEFHKVSKDGRI
jgi:hypothetical protein